MMKNNELIGLIARKADISPAEAFEALAATFQILIDNLCGTVFTTISIAPDPDDPAQIFINVGNPPKPHTAINVGNPPQPHADINVGIPPQPHAAINVGIPPQPHAAINVGNPPQPHSDINVGIPPQPHLERQPAGLLAYVAGRVGIPSDKAALAIGVIFEQINIVAREAGVRVKP